MSIKITILLISILSCSFAADLLNLKIENRHKAEAFKDVLQVETVAEKDLSSGHGHAQTFEEFQLPEEAYNDEFLHLKSFPTSKLAKVYDFPSNKPFGLYRRISHGKSTADKIAIDQEGKNVIAGLSNTTTLVYNVQNGNVVFAYENEYAASSVAITSKYLAIGNPKDQVKIYDPKYWQLQYTSSDGYYISYDVAALAFSYDDLFLGAGNGRYVDTFATNPFDKDQVNFQSGSELVHDVAFSRDNKYLVSASKGHIEIWEDKGTTWQQHHTLDVHYNDMIRIALSSSYLAVTSGGATVDIYKVGWWHKETTLQLSGKTQYCAFSGNNGFLAVSNDEGTVTIYNTGTWEIFQTIEGGFDKINSISFSSDKLVVDFTKNGNGAIGIYDQFSGSIKLFVSAIMFAILSFFTI